MSFQITLVSSPFLMAELLGARGFLFALQVFSLARLSGRSAQQADDAARDRGLMAGDVSAGRFGWTWSCRSPHKWFPACVWGMMGLNVENGLCETRTRWFAVA